MMARMLTASILLGVFFLSGALAKCPASANDLFIDTPETMEALKGSCLHIPCTFRPRIEGKFDSTQPIIGLWLKQVSADTNKVVYRSDWKTNEYPMNITGNLNLKQCTTLFSNLIPTYEGTYFFRMESEAFRATAVRDCLQIKVRDSPPKPIMEIPADLKENVSVTIMCSAVTPCPLYPPKLTWNLKRDSNYTMEENRDGTFTRKIQETITLTYKHDGYNISCFATYPVNGGRDNKTEEETKTLSVSYAPKNTSVSVSPPGLLSAGVSVTLSCSSTAKPRVSSFTWFKMSSDGPMNVSEGEIYSFNVTEGGVYFCVAMNKLGDERSLEIHLKVEGLGSLSGAVIGGIIGIILLICLVLCLLLVFMCWRRSKSAKSSQQNLCETGEELPKRTTQDEEDIHYGEIDFSKRRSEKSSDSMQDSRQQQETLYAQVKGPGLEQDMLYAQVKGSGLEQDMLYAQVKGSGLSADDPESLYAEVKTN
ncbi:B-cell receptor CD22-like [Cheilinus undulatus]|uniref:B-cell receptor CD22-like n=1 Tax=Cheilinus undulatus TaxID=241271 RepID=UPI001BD1FC10|nr:B-cell receptor CD22-like [Cheilinus undulatus]